MERETVPGCCCGKISIQDFPRMTLKGLSFSPQSPASKSQVRAFTTTILEVKSLDSI